MVSRKLATLGELQSIYGLEDLFDLVEIVTIDAINRRIADDT